MATKKAKTPEIPGRTTFLTQRETADRLGLSSRQVHNLTAAGMPRRVRGGKPFHPWPESARWYIEHRIQGGRTDAGAGVDAAAERRALELRKLAAEVRRSEILLSHDEGRLVTLDYMEQQLQASLERVRARLQNVAGKWAPALVGLRSISEAQARLEPAVAEVMQALTETGDDPELDAESDAEQGD